MQQSGVEEQVDELELNKIKNRWAASGHCREDPCGEKSKRMFTYV